MEKLEKPCMKGTVLTPICPYCRQPSEEVGGLVIYKHRPDLAHLRFFLCTPCDAYVGTHRGTRKPLGTLANANLRRLRNAAHTAFDPLWSDEGMPRKTAYAWLAQSMGLRDDECHIAMFNEDQCRMTVKLCWLSTQTSVRTERLGRRTAYATVQWDQ